MFFLVITSELLAQKTMVKSWDGNVFNQIELISNQVTKVTFKNTNSDLIIVSAKVEGEYHESMLLESVEKNGVLSLKPRFRPYFEANNDKLAAHKVMAIELTIETPSNKAIHVLSESSSVTMYGQYLEVFVGLRDGQCVLKKFTGNAKLQTRDGDIYVEAHHQTKAQANSQYGVVKNDLKDGRKFKIEAQSVNGLITLVKSQE